MKTIINAKVLLAALLLIMLAATTARADSLFRIVEGMDDARLRGVMENNVATMLATFNTAASQQQRNLKLSKDNFTPDAIRSLSLVWKSSAMIFPPVNIMGRCLRTSAGYQVRGIPVDMVEAAKDEARQELTVDFTPEGKISNVSIAIDMHRYDMIMAEKASDIDYARRQVIIDFVENFRTAYNRKDIDLLTRVFSDKALIITGRVVSEKPNTDIDRMTLYNNKVVYIKQSKQEYLGRLSSVFKNTKYINVKFDEIEVMQHPKYDDIYGVTLKQYWHTDRYSDEGYLFLLVDFRDDNQPLIQVRTWQPFKDQAGNVVTKREDVYHLGSFRIVRQ